WNGLRFILEGLAFVLIGFQLRLVLADLSHMHPAELLGDCLLVCVTTIVVRLAFVFAWTYLPSLLGGWMSMPIALPPWKHAVLIGWSGMRGVDSLAAALALPLFVADNVTPFPQRNLILFLSFSVILTTLVLQGLSLPGLIRRLKFPVEEAARRDEAQVRIATAEAAIRRLEELEQTSGLPSATVSHLRAIYQVRIQRYQSRLASLDRDQSQPGIDVPGDLMLELLKSEREAVNAIRAQGLIGDEALQRVERSLDYQELRLNSEGLQSHDLQ
ncbi:MAG: Na+/H+ antiporter, partial [Planctomycetaceae bacterium]|nr:Na+/H+ antiporter [Planctomycetaceae bacterium]